MNGSQDTVIGRARFRAVMRGGAVPAMPQASLARARLRPGRLGPSAVLVVRHLADPRPGTLPLGGTGPVPELWERAAVSELDRLLRHAARPARETVPTAAEAVLFADRSELLAALASDWLAGDMADRWWWRLLTSRAPSPVDAVSRVWRDAARYVPAALGQLAERGRAAAFAGALPDAAAMSLAAAAAAAFGVPDVLTRTAPGPGLGGRVPGLVPPKVPAGSAGSAGSAGPPWSGWACEAAAASPGTGRRLLLGVGLGLVRSPAAASRPEFWATVGEWTRQDAPQPMRYPAGQPPLGRANRPGAPGARGAGHTAPGAGPDTPVHTVRPGPSPAGAPDGPDTLHPSATPRRPGTVPDQRSAPRTPGVTGRPAPHEAAGAARHAALPAPGPTADGPGPTDPDFVDTAYGGLFYLLNLALRLGLYGDFSTPGEPGIALHPFDLLALLGPELLTDPDPADGIWPLLADLVDRTGGAVAGAAFVPTDDWRVPVQWLAPFDDSDDDAAWLWSSAHGRLRVRHPAGFTILDTALEASPPGGRRPEGRRPCADRIRRWLAALGDYARARLALALDHPPATVVDRVVRHRARVFVTPVHVDIALSLDALPVEVRIAGLDRDPGWLPAAGRAVSFRFD